MHFRLFCNFSHGLGYFKFQNRKILQFSTVSWEAKLGENRLHGDQKSFFTRYIRTIQGTQKLSQSVPRGPIDPHLSRHRRRTLLDENNFSTNFWRFWPFWGDFWSKLNFYRQQIFHVLKMFLTRIVFSFIASLDRSQYDLFLTFWRAEPFLARGLIEIFEVVKKVIFQ